MDLLRWLLLFMKMTKAEPSSPYALVADDDAFLRMDAADILEEAGFNTFEASNGDDALAVLRVEHDKVVLLFTDVQMPGGSRDGFALARETAQRWPHIAIVVASGDIKPKPGDMPEGARFIAKPFSAELVHTHVQEILPDGRKPETLRHKG